MMAISFMISCDESLDDCATCYHVKKDLSNSSQERVNNEGVKCGNELDSIESIAPFEMDGYEYSYQCE